MYGYIEGFSDTDTIRYCPKCASKIGEFFSDGTGKCSECGMRFAVIEIDEERGEE
jgi:DNA-directed RNA polymerase subunit RPC12/RpoP